MRTTPMVLNKQIKEMARRAVATIFVLMVTSLLCLPSLHAYNNNCPPPPFPKPPKVKPVPPGGGGCGGCGGRGGGGGPPATTPTTCPIDALKLGLCLDLLGGLVHIGLGDPVVNTCCPVIQGLLELEAAICLCTTIRLKLLNLNIFIPIALQVLATCGMNIPPGFTCPPL